MDVGRQHRGQVSTPLRMLHQPMQMAEEGSLQQLVLFFQASVALGWFAQIARGRGVGHQNELDETAIAVRQAHQAGIGGQVKPARRAQLTRLSCRRCGKGHHQAERLAKGLVVVVARDRQDRAAAAKEGFEGGLQMGDRLAQTIGTAQLAEEIACDQQHLYLFALAVACDALDGTAQIVGAIDAS